MCYEGYNMQGPDYILFKGPLSIEVFNFHFKKGWHENSNIVKRSIVLDYKHFNESTIELVYLGGNEEIRKFYYDSNDIGEDINTEADMDRGFPEIRIIKSNIKQPDIIKTIIVENVKPDWHHTSPNAVYSHTGSCIIRAY